MGVNISIIRDGNFRHPRYANFRPRHKYGLIPLGRAARNWCHEIITLDFKIRETVQREIYITEELEARRKSDPSEPMSDRERAIRRDWERDLKTLAKAYWEYERKLYHLEVSAPSEIAMRAYKTLREDEYCMLMERAYIWGFDTQQSAFRSVIQWNFGGLICDVNKFK
ncbi:hypothetical protein MPDQ_006206 [Monascus purpureus]|uniref:Uncharacterized protein n=1 Tax=Monascus purpureus TaxID=5098 RepID=A0A507QX57_MONPU|nr:hypothetical protein MPDQ_006206 [Monascus purpureus]